ncbi:hypothetical protein ISN76_02215 [Dyella halodurans]|uniref:Uncharacterized protein n=1 Tax=Dyella halodurans TaxID=1920171 RepID=A0ABV9BZ95_9GAMM|nr:hypothetical protein [Dyella halodurans]
MSTPDNLGRSSHLMLRAVLVAVAIGVLVACALMWWWVRAPDIYDPAADLSSHAQQALSLA